MNIKLKFKNINECNGVPKLCIYINSKELFKGVVSSDKNNNTDVKVQDNVVIADKNCELEDIIVDGYNLEELKWRGIYVTEDDETIDGCLFFGKNGYFELNFESPVLRWILKTRHELLNNDPYWEQDYESYTTACKLIHSLN